MAVNSKVKIRRSVYNIFTKKYGLHVQTDATKYLESLLEREDDLVDTLEKIVKAYKKRYSGKETNSAKGEEAYEIGLTTDKRRGNARHC